MNRYSVGTDRESRLVTLDEDDWKQIVRLLGRATVGTHSTHAKGLESSLDRARQAFAERRRRVPIFGTGMFGEPAWDILLVLYIERHAHRHSIGSLAKVAGTAPSTTLRWIEALESRDFVFRTEHPTDKRATFVQLTSKGEAALDSYFSETLRPVR